MKERGEEGEKGLGAPCSSEVKGTLEVRRRRRSLGCSFFPGEAAELSCGMQWYSKIVKDFVDFFIFFLLLNKWKYFVGIIDFYSKLDLLY